MHFIAFLVLSIFLVGANPWRVDVGSRFVPLRRAMRTNLSQVGTATARANMIYDAFKGRAARRWHGIRSPRGGWGTVPVYVAGIVVGGPRPGRAVPGGSDAGFSAAGTGGEARTRRRPGTRAVPVRGAVRAERGVGGCRVVAGFPFAAGEPDRVIPVAGPVGPALPLPGRGPPRPGRTRPGSGVSVRRCPMRPQAPVQRRSHAPPSAPPVRTHCDHHPGASRQCEPGCSAYPGEAVPRSAPSGVKRSLNLLYLGRARPTQSPAHADRADPRPAEAA